MVILVHGVEGAPFERGRELGDEVHLGAVLLGHEVAQGLLVLGAEIRLAGRLSEHLHRLAEGDPGEGALRLREAPRQRVLGGGEGLPGVLERAAEEFLDGRPEGLRTVKVGHLSIDAREFRQVAKRVT
ncbi:MAG: hypothetical protein M1143_00085, partial [Candidatus Thermoplasmatota archaeon]|nr:hypothetical protein [Candidatus Thermoplasmatota archaeon]